MIRFSHEEHLKAVAELKTLLGRKEKPIIYMIERSVSRQQTIRVVTCYIPMRKHEGNGIYMNNINHLIFLLGIGNVREDYRREGLKISGGGFNVYEDLVQNISRMCFSAEDLLTYQIL
jgi:hypothetical protein